MSNAALIRLNALLKGVAGLSFVGAAAGVVVDLGGYADQLRALGLNLPKKWLAVLLIIGAAGHVAAYFAKTPSQAIAAAVPPGQTPGPAPLDLKSLIPPDARAAGVYPPRNPPPDGTPPPKAAA